jgi:hypothetical protein
MGEDFSGSVEETTIDDREAFVGRSRFSFNHALLLATDAAHRRFPSEPAEVRLAVILGENPPIGEYRVAIIPGGG